MRIDGTYQIVYGEDPSPSEKKGAEELRLLILRASGIYLPIVTDKARPRAKEIVVGRTNREKFFPIDRERTGDEGFYIRTVQDRLFIAGGEKRGTLYGVYTFCEKYLGYRFFTPETTVVPRLKRIEFSDIDDFERPLFSFREVMWKSGFETVWSVRNKINRGQWRTFPAEYGGGIVYAGWLCHTLGELAETGYDAPEPCLTDPKIFQTVLENCRKRLKERPDAEIMPVSQNDDFRYCTCENCRRVDAEEGSHAGTMIRFVNAIAEELERDFPHVKVKTLAYQYTRRPPKTAPRKNVIVELCSIECCRSHALSESDVPAPAPWAEVEEGDSFQRDIANWHKIAPELHVWDYTTNYHHYFSPFPNITNLRKNVRFFAENGVTGVLEQGNINSPVSGEFGELKNYLLAKLLWDPYMSENEYGCHLREFMAEYYGEGYELLLGYIHESEQLVQKRHVGIYYHPLRIFPKEEGTPFMLRARELFQMATKKARRVEQKLHVRRAQIQIDYYLQIAQYEERYQKGTNVSRRAYVADNKKLYAFLLENDIYMNPDITLPPAPDFTRPPDEWHKLG